MYAENNKTKTKTKQNKTFGIVVGARFFSNALKTIDKMYAELIYLHVKFV